MHSQPVAFAVAASPRCRRRATAAAGTTTAAAHLALRLTLAPLALVAFAVFAAAAAPLRAQPSLQTSVSGFVDVNGNGALDCGEPVLLTAAYATRDSGTPALTGRLLVGTAGTAGLLFQPGSLRIDNDLTTGCQATVGRGNSPGDAAGEIDFSCPADPLDDNSWTVVVTWRAVFAATATPAFTSTAQATTSDGRSYTAAANGAGAAACADTPSHVTLTKTAAGSAAPGTPLVYTLATRDLSGLGDGGLQLVETVPANTRFDAADSSPGWVCSPDGNPGATCRNPIGNLAPSGTLTSLFAVTLDAPLAAGVALITNTACVREGPTTVAACASAATPTTGAPALRLVKTLAGGSGTPGTVLTYDLAVSNTGNQGAGGAVLTETVPAATAFDAAASPGWSCVPAAGTPGAACTAALGPLAAGATAHKTFAVTVANPLAAGVTAITNTACATPTSTPAPTAGFAKTAAAAAAVPTCSTVSTPALGSPSLTLAKSYTGAPATAGATLAFALAYANRGNQDAAAASLGETVPDDTAFLAAASSPGWTCDPPAGGAGAACTLALGGLPAGAAGSRTFAVAAGAPLPPTLLQIANSACLSDAAGHTDCAQAQAPVAQPGPGSPNPPGPPAAVPALGGAGLVTLGALLGTCALGRLRRSGHAAVDPAATAGALPPATDSQAWPR